MEGQGQILTVTAPRGELLSKHKHRDGACTLRRLYSKRLDTKLVDITAMQEVAARNREHTHSSKIMWTNLHNIKRDVFITQGSINLDLQ